MMTTRNDILVHLKRLHDTGFADKLATSAIKHGLPVEFVYAIASRETNCTNELGDWQDHEAHGVGILQIDVQHDLARTMRDDGTWKTNPDPLIEFGVKMLATNLADAMQNFTNIDSNQQFQLAADGYNEGMGRADRLEKQGINPDKGTTGGNYGVDVLGRMLIFKGLLVGSPQ